jgi:hypothetical protein
MAARIDALVAISQNSIFNFFIAFTFTVAHLGNLTFTNYPKTANCYDGLGDLYLAKGNKFKAIESFKKTLSLKFIPETKQKLKTLERKGENRGTFGK